MLTNFGGDRMKTLGRVHEIALNAFSKQSNMADFLLVEQIGRLTVSMKVVWLMRSIGV